MILKDPKTCYSTAEMIQLITGTKPTDLRETCQLRPQLAAKGIKLKLDDSGLSVPTGLDVIALDEDCERYLRQHPELIPGK